MSITQVPQSNSPNSYKKILYILLAIFLISVIGMWLIKPTAFSVKVPGGEITMSNSDADKIKISLQTKIDSLQKLVGDLQKLKADPEHLSLKDTIFNLNQRVERSIHDGNQLLAKFILFKDMSTKEKEQLLSKTMIYLSNGNNPSQPYQFGLVEREQFQEIQINELKQKNEKLLADNATLKSQVENFKITIAKLSSEKFDAEKFKQLYNNALTQIEALKNVKPTSQLDDSNFKTALAEIESLRSLINLYKTDSVKNSTVLVDLNNKLKELENQSKSIASKLSKVKRIRIENPIFEPDKVRRRKDATYLLCEMKSIKFEFKAEENYPTENLPINLKLVFSIPISKTESVTQEFNIEVLSGKSFSKIINQSDLRDKKGQNFAFVEGPYHVQIFDTNLSNTAPILIRTFGVEKCKGWIIKR